MRFSIAEIKGDTNKAYKLNLHYSSRSAII